MVADRWEFANEFFRKGHKHLLSEIHRRKTSQVVSPHQHFQPQLYTLPPSDDDKHHNHVERSSSCWRINEPPTLALNTAESDDYLSALSEDNQRLRRKNSLLVSEITHMKKLYNDIIYFIQNHVTPRPGRVMELGSSSVTITEELVEAPESSVKLFGVALSGKKRLHSG